MTPWGDSPVLKLQPLRYFFKHLFSITHVTESEKKERKKALAKRKKKKKYIVTKFNR